MKRILGAAVGGLLCTAVATHGAWAFGVKDVVAMHENGVADSLITQKIVYSGTRFHLDSRDLATLQKAGVSAEVVSTMLKSEGRRHEDDERGPYDGYYHPYYAPYYAPHYYYHYRPYYPRVSFGLSFGYRGGYRGGFRHWRRF